MNTNQVIGALSADLLRVALGYHQGAIQMANRFLKEAHKRQQEIDTNQIPPFLKQLLETMEHSLKQTDTKQLAEDALMYSSILQNYLLKHA